MATPTAEFVNLIPGNLLTQNQYSLETDTTGWTAQHNCTLARSTAQAQHGSASLEVTRAGAVDHMNASTEAARTVAVAGNEYTAEVYFRAATTGRTCLVSLRFYDASSVFISEFLGATVIDSTTGWTKAITSGTAPSGATQVDIICQMQNPGAAEVHYIDAAKIQDETTRLDINPGGSAPTYRILKDSVDLTPPSLRYAEADGGVLRDGSFISASAYNNRILKMRLHIYAATADALATAIQNLARELDRETNILKWNTGQTNPVYFRTLRSPLSNMNIEFLENRVEVDLEILAEPFAYGTRVAQAAQTLNNDPAAAGTGCFIDITGVKGDVPTPLFLQHDEPTNNNDYYIMGVRQHGTPSDMTIFAQCESMTLGTDTTSVADASASGGNVARTTFATPTMVTRLTATMPKAAPTLAEARANRGTYRVFAVVEKSAATDAINLQLVGPSGVANTKQAVPNGVGRKIVDLGLVQVPYGPAAEVFGPGYSGVEGGAAPVTIEVQAERTSGAGNLESDFLLYVPADEGLCIANFSTTSVEDRWFDGPNNAAYLAADSWLTGDQAAANVPARVGSIPALFPNQTNRLVMLLGRSTTNLGAGEVQPDWTKAHTASLVVHYWPRHLYVQPA